jgi:LmbE family N-acetylglucosaminyl deacetylase/diadenosine tetraphosphate (Ap4A) HIT family hydrolase
LTDVHGCLACDLAAGREPLPGGLIHETGGWLIEHCTGPLGVGTLIIKPRRHAQRFADLTPEEYEAFGRTVWLATAALRELLAPDQTYVCQWAHAGWKPGHIHFVVQPARNSDREKHALPGPFLQAEMFAANETPAGSGGGGVRGTGSRGHPAPGRGGGYAMSKRVLVIVAHADDMEFMAGGTVAKMADLGYEIREVIATNNERGTLDPEWDERFTAETRREEARRGAGVLGVNPDVEFLGYEDGRLSETPLNELRERCMRAIRTHRPDILFTWDPWAPYEEHGDHRSIGLAATEAASFAHFPLYHPEHRADGLQPHYTGERYFFAKAPRDANKAVDISGQIDRKIEALCEHACQMEMTVMEAQAALAASGLEAPFLRDADPRDYRPLIEAQIKAWAASVGQRAGFAYGEEFRRTRFGGAARWLPEGEALRDDF